MAETVKPNIQMALEFLLAMHYGRLIHLVAIKPGTAPTAKTFETSSSEAIGRWIENRNTDGANIYWHVNELIGGIRGRKAKKEDVLQAVMLHVDIDDPSDVVLERLREFTPKPSAVIFSGGGYQAFWLLENPDADFAKVEGINAGLAKLLGGDNCQNIDRVMRVPGTINWPNEKKRKAGRVSVLAKTLATDTDFARSIDASMLAEFVERFGPVVKTHVSSEQVPMFEMTRVEDLALNDHALVDLILLGDDPQRPRSSQKPRFPSRSEAFFSVACGLAKRGFSAELIAGILINPSYGISEAVLEKSNAAEFAFRQAQKAIAKISDGWPDVHKSGEPRPTFANALTGLFRLDLTFEYDAFRGRKRVGGHELNEFAGDLTDDAAAMLRKVFLETFGFDVGKNNLYDALQVICLQNSFHPIRDYLDSVQWDGIPRVETWLGKYMGAEDCALNRAIAKILLIAAVRRIRVPGAKFDTMLVLEGAQGSGKSTAVQILAGEENFSDQNLMTLDDKAQMEALQGVWLYEVAELDGMSRAEVSKIKAFISRTEDRGRPAYARFKEIAPRQCILIGTTNEAFYLKDTTGNRRFLPVLTGVIDLEGLKQDRDFLWAEASKLEKDGETLVLPRALWDDAAQAQSKRLQEDPWLDILARVKGVVREGVERVSTEELMGEMYLNIPPANRQNFHPKRIATVMRELGWLGPKKTRLTQGDHPVRGYERATNADDTPEI